MAAAPAEPRTDLDLKKFRRLLEREQQRITSEIAEINALDETGGSAGETSEPANYDQHPADQGTELFLREQDQAILRNLHAEQGQVEAALRKVDEGAYGICERCDAPIPAGRLEALPYAVFCIQCASDIEGQMA